VDFRDPNDAERAEIQTRIAQLDDDDGMRRDAAGNALLRIGWRADGLLEKASKESASAEIKLRARRLRETLRTTPAAVIRGHEEAVGCAAFSPDGRWLATAGGDGPIVFWEAKSRAKAFALECNPN
jgi:WD40 repeat protein